ncbi:alpha/beta fold hydrolase [Aestuariibacter halophilus]|uniref:Alpha/beta fold hydrolase n=1 Tax=Fluctibacter halophilus TaxID=226011 RepID=A0ABS8G4C4_9ALTE|nr:alpha/beta fold hydrolase [Aestuariibacter halophilus]MCC2615373.1 alpha/beta fold hydrolase [Aestuariibacter halophilus]
MLLNHEITTTDENAPWLVLLHGLFGSLDNLNGVKRALQNQFNIVNIDLPDHGLSPRTDRFSFTDWAQRVEAVLDQANIQQAHLLGHSLGGKVMMTLAQQSPKRATSLIVADIAPTAYSPRHQNVLAALTGVTLDTITRRQDADQQLKQHITEPGVRQFLLKSLYADNHSWQWRFNLSLLQRDYALLSDAIPDREPYEGPTLFIKGERSDYLGPQHQADIKRRFPNSSAKIIAATGHWLHAEKPEAFARVVSRFIDTVEQG